MSDTDPYAAPEVHAHVHEVKSAQQAPVAPIEEVVVQTAAEAVEAPQKATQPITAVKKLEVPEGSVKSVLAWVGTDADRANAALDAERSGDKRSSLIQKLEALTD